MKKIILGVLALICFLLVGCTITKEVVKEVPVEVIHDVYHNVYVHDTSYVTDSSIVYIKGDTIFKEKYRYIYQERLVHDTLATHDTIPQIINTETTKVVEKKVPQWWPVWVACGLVLLSIIGIIAYKIYKKFI